MEELKKLSIYLLIICTITIFFCDCKKKETSAILKRSIRSDIDIYLIPQKYNLLVTKKSEVFKPIAHFDKKQLLGYLKKYNRSIEDLKKNDYLKYSEKDGIVSMKVEGTSHSTIYPYDQNIPILFYGNKWFKKGKYEDTIHLAHIVPTLTQILNIKRPNGVETQPVKKILKADSNSIPEIIVTILIDQGGKQVYEAHSDTPKNIQKLFEEGSYFPNAQVGYIDAHTATGHVSLSTGGYPRKNGIIGNKQNIWKDNQLITKNIYLNEKGELDTSVLKTETLADALDYELGNEIEVISQAHAMRASIGMAGHGSYLFRDSYVKGDQDYVYWLSKEKTSWETDTKYYNIDRITRRYNPYLNFKRKYRRGKYNIRLRRRSDYRKYWYYVMSTPAQVELETSLFLKMLEQKVIKTKKNQDKLTDLAYLNLKSLDKAGHLFGWESLEAKETFQEIDKQVGVILEFLQKNFGDNFILVLTADHGCAPLPEISGGKRLNMEKLFQETNSLLPKGNNGSIIQYMTTNQIALNKKIMLKHNIKEKDVIKKIQSIKVDGKPFYQKVISKFDLF